MYSTEKFHTETEKAAQILKRGGIILYPTDTVWGIGCDATNEEAVAAIYRLKQRADSKSMLSLVASVEMLSEWVSNIPQVALDLIEDTDLPITIIYDHPRGIAKNLLADDGSLGIRIAKDDFCKALCRECGVPVVSTSANISGHPTASYFSDVEDVIKNNVDYIVDLRREDRSTVAPSKIVKVSDDGEMTIIRK